MEIIDNYFDLSFLKVKFILKYKSIFKILKLYILLNLIINIFFRRK